MSKKGRKRRKPQRRAPVSGGQAISYRLAAQMAVLDERVKFTYFIPHQPQNLTDASFFGFYTPGLHESEGMLLAACTLPADVREPFTHPEGILQLRLSRALWRRVVPIDIRSLSELAATTTVADVSLFRVVLTNSQELADAVDRIHFSDGVPFLHVSSVSGPKRLSHKELDVLSLIQFTGTVLTYLDKTPERREFVQWVRDAMPPKEQRTGRPHPAGLAFHNVTLPNEIALSSFGWILDKSDPLVPDGKRPPESKRYIERICSLADDVTVRRAQLMRRRGIPASLCDWSYIITVPSVHWMHYKSWRAISKQISAEKFRAAQALYQAAVNQSTYFDGFEIPGNVTRQEIEAAPEFRALLASRARDHRCYTAGLSLLASATLAPVLRIEPKINRVRPHLEMLGVSARTGRAGSVQLKQSRLARVIGTTMRKLVDPEFLTRIDRYLMDRSVQGMKIVADLPIEWLPIDDLPMMLRYDVSKVPVLPGNLYIQHCIRPPVVLRASGLTEVLVVRSFTAEDKLKSVLESAVTRVVQSAGIKDMLVLFKDVFNETELVEAINSHQGAILIFDCHGGYEEKNGVGTIVIAGQPIEVWDLRERCRLPPIVIFSACDTHPLDGGHGSSANAAFVLGASSVLGTMLPIDAGVAASFIARLILRIAEYIPIALKVRNILTWREVISGMIRMAYASEVLRILTDQAGFQLRSGGDDRVQLVANMAISERRADWFEQFVAAIAAESGRQAADIKCDILRWAYMTDATKYVQLGAPENIVILPDVGPQQLSAPPSMVGERGGGPAQGLDGSE